MSALNIMEGRKLYSLYLPLEMFKEKPSIALYPECGICQPSSPSDHKQQKGHFLCVSVLLASPGWQAAGHGVSPWESFLVVCA